MIFTTISRLILNLVRIQGKGRPREALGGILCVAESSTRRYPFFQELVPSSASPALDRPRSPKKQLSIVYLRLKRLSLTALVMAKINAEHIDLYEPDTQKERGYIHKILSVYKKDNIDDTATIAAAAVQKDIEDYA